jgi:hypothetical protein
MTLALTETKQMEMKVTPTVTIDLNPRVEYVMKSLVSKVEETWQPPTYEAVHAVVFAEFHPNTKMDMMVNIAVARTAHQRLRDLAESLRI